MLSSHQRLTRADFSLLQSGSRVVHSKHVTLRFTSRLDEISLFSFVVSGKVAPLAVDRNLLKRRGRAIVKGLLPQISSGYLCAFFFKKGAREQSYAALSQEITDLLGAAGIIHNLTP